MTTADRARSEVGGWGGAFEPMPAPTPAPPTAPAPTAPRFVHSSFAACHRSVSSWNASAVATFWAISELRRTSCSTAFCHSAAGSACLFIRCCREPSNMNAPSITSAVFRS